MLNQAAPCDTQHNTYCKSKMSAECVVNALALLQAHAEAASLKSSAFARQNQLLSGLEQHSQRARLQSSVDSPGSIEYTEVKGSDHLQGHHVCRLTHNEAVGGFIQRQLAARPSPASNALSRTAAGLRPSGPVPASTPSVKLGAADVKTHDDVLAESRLAMALRPRQRGGNKLQSQY